MPLREETLITRSEAANLILSPNAPKEEKAIIKVYENRGFHPPEDFVVTQFDILVLQQYTLFGSQVETSEIKSIVENAFHELGCEITVKEEEIHNYFTVLRGDVPGKLLAEGKGEALSSNFPQIRDRYNCLCILKFLEDSKRSESFSIADYKRILQLEIATRIIAEQTQTRTSQELGFKYPHLIVDIVR